MTWMPRFDAVVATVLLALLAPVASATEFATSSDGVRIAYEVHGAGAPALVFVHGWSCDRTYWQAQLEPFSRDHRVVAIDLGGHGESGLDRGHWTIESFGDDVAAVVQKLDLGRVVLIGHSMGGDVVVAAAKRLTDRVAGIVWVDSYRQLGAPRMTGTVEEVVAPFRANFREHTAAFVRTMFTTGSDPKLVDRIAADMSSAPPQGAIPAVESLLAYWREVPPALEALRVPVVAINAGYLPTDLDSMRSHGVDVVTMPDVGHFLMIEDPVRFDALLESVTDRFDR